MNKETINKIRKYFKDKPVIKAYVFGSHARNEAEEDSDVDILVELDYSKKVGMEFINMQIGLEELLQKKVDLVSANGLSKFIKPYVDKDKIVIYEK